MSTSSKFVYAALFPSIVVGFFCRDLDLSLFFSARICFLPVRSSFSCLFNLTSTISSSESSESPSIPNSFLNFLSYADSRSEILFGFLTLFAKLSLLTSIPFFSSAAVISSNYLTLLLALVLDFSRLLCFIIFILPLNFLIEAARSFADIPSSSELLSASCYYNYSICKILSSSSSKALSLASISAS